ncbi:MAG: phosphatase/phosphohexomutase HAD superfamily [Puniceicoccaceae bacterium 5H]|nr:MAG: phosphatase/phosphohexomutase HAD superfamily [Puniceicoccaceae bacterium 5H]
MGIAAIFDWDGTLVDSSAAHKWSWEKLAEEEDLKLPPNHFTKSFGYTNPKIIREIYAWSEDPDEMTRLGDRKEELYRAKLQTMQLKPLPGVLPFLQALRDAGVPCAIGTSTPRENIRVAARAAGLNGYFAASTCGDEVKHGKPDPEVFLRCAWKLGVQPQHCVVFEDAPHGLEAAKNAQMTAIGLTTTHPARDLPQADLTIDTFHELSASGLKFLLR